MRAGVSVEPRPQDSRTELASISGAVLEWEVQQPYSRAATTIGRRAGLWLLGNVRSSFCRDKDSIGINAGKP